MALVRCPIHKIPYNDENPRGCPACAMEKEGGGTADIMQELAKASQPGRRVSKPEITPPAEAPPPPPEPSPFEPEWEPLEEESHIRSWRRILLGPQAIVVGAMIIVILAATLFLTTRPRFVAQEHPAAVQEDEVRPLPLEPGAPVPMVFALLGTQDPRPVPEAPRLARYSYGSDLAVDVINEAVYALTFSLPNRSWRGLRPGMPEQTARGTLALLGPPEDLTPGVPAAPARRGQYFVYASLAERPRRILRAAVRPPNGCFDILVELRPRAEGLLLRDGRRYAVVSRAEESLEWAASRVQVIDRSVEGPYAEGVACEAGRTMP
jgi:hypothetical protein